MTCSCPFENTSYGEFYMESLQSQPNPGDSVLGHCRGLIHVFEIVNIRRGPKNGLTPECEVNDRKNAN